MNINHSFAKKIHFLEKSVYSSTFYVKNTFWGAIIESFRACKVYG